MLIAFVLAVALGRSSLSATWSSNVKTCKTEKGPIPVGESVEFCVNEGAYRVTCTRDGDHFFGDYQPIIGMKAEKPTTSATTQVVTTTPCGWAEWNEWVGRCDRSVCGWGDKHTRTRRCKAGCDCEGASSETEPCGNRDLCRYPVLTCCPPYVRVVVTGKRFACGIPESPNVVPVTRNAIKAAARTVAVPYQVLPANLTRQCLPCGDFRVEVVDEIGPELSCSIFRHVNPPAVHAYADCDHEHLVVLRGSNVPPLKSLQCTSSGWSVGESKFVPTNPIVACVLIGNGKNIYDIP